MADGTPIVVPLVASLTALKKGLAEASTRIGKFGKGVGKAVGGIAKGFGAIGVAASGAAVKGVQEFASLDKKVREVLTLSGGETTKAAVENMTSRVREIATGYGQAAEDVAEAFYNSISAGVDSTLVDKFAEDAAKLATAGGTTIGAAVDILTSATNAFGLSAEDAGKVSDTLFATVKAGKTTVDEIASSFSQIGPIAAATGVSLEDVSSWLGALTLSGTPTAQAATQIKAAIAELSKPSSKIAKEFKRITNKTFPEFVKEGGSLSEALKVMELAGKTTEGGMVSLFGSIEAYQGVLGVTGEATGLFNSTLSTVQEAAGSTDEAFKTMSEGAAFSFAKLREKMNEMMGNIGAAVLPAVEALIPALMPIIDTLGGALSELFIAIAPVITQLVNGLMPALQGLIPPLLEIVQALLPPLSDLLLALMPAIIPLANILADVLVVAAKGLGVAVRFIATGIEMLMEWLGPLLTTLSELTGSLVEQITPAMDGLIASTGWAVEIYKDIWEIMKSVGFWFRDVGMAIWRAGGEEFLAILGGIGAFFAATFNGAKEVIGAVIRYFDRVWVPRWKAGFEVLKKVIGFFYKVFQKNLNLTKTILKAVINFFRSVVIPAWKKGWDLFMKPVKVARGVIKGIFDFIVKVIRKVGELISKLKNIPGVKQIGGLLGGAKNVLGGIFGFAEGGIVTRPVMGLVGEAGPEAIIPLSELGNLGGGSVYNDNRQVVINGGFATSAELGEMAEAALQNWQARKGALDLDIA